jgi:hypothetical protein
MKNTRRFKQNINSSPIVNRRKRKARTDFHIRNGMRILGNKDDLQECKTCHKILPLTGFTTWGTGSNGTYYLRKDCRECQSRANTESWFVRQNAPPPPERCDCCHQPSKKLQTDHVHGERVLRGWICRQCNTAIGKMGDNLEGVLQAAIYVENDKDKIIETLHTVFNKMFARTT